LGIMKEGHIVPSVGETGRDVGAVDPHRRKLLKG